MDKTIYQAKKQVSQKQTSVPKLKLKKRLKPIELAQKISNYLDDLPMASFVFIPQDLESQDTIPLPEETGQILYKEGVLDKEGQLIWENQNKLDDKKFVHQLENKILQAIIQKTIRVQIYDSLKKTFKTSDLQSTMLDKSWDLTARLLSLYYAPIASAIFMSERYPDRLTNTKIVQKVPTNMCNKIVFQKIQEQMIFDKAKIKETIEIFIKNSPFLKKINNKKNLLSLSTKKAINIVPAACYFLPNLGIEINYSQSEGLKIDTVLTIV